MGLRLAVCYSSQKRRLTCTRHNRTQVVRNRVVDSLDRSQVVVGSPDRSQAAAIPDRSQVVAAIPVRSPAAGTRVEIPVRSRAAVAKFAHDPVGAAAGRPYCL